MQPLAWAFHKDSTALGRSRKILQKTTELRLTKSLATHWLAPCPPLMATVGLLLPASKAPRELELTSPAAIDHLWGRPATVTEALLTEGLANHQMQKHVFSISPMHLRPSGSLRLCLSGPCLRLCLCLYLAVGCVCPRLWMCNLACHDQIRHSSCTWA